ncbi:hypothetical protein GCM10027399_31800 [Curvibacter fontanus]
MSIPAYNDHPARATLNQIVELQKSPAFADPTVADNEQYAFSRDKVFAMANAVDLLLRNTPAELTSIPALNQLQTHLQASLSELNGFVGNKNPGHISNAAQQFEQNVLPYLWGFTPAIQTLSPNSLASLLKSQGNVSKETVRQLVTQRDELAAKLQNLSNLTDAQATRLEGLVEGAAKERAEAAATVAKLEQVFAQKETERATAFDTAMAELRNEFKQFAEKSKNESTTLISDIEAKKTQAARIVQVVGNIGVTGNYQQIANSESDQANIWRRITVGIFIGGITVAAFTFYKFWDQPFTPETAWSVVVRLLYAMAITAPAWYTARESARHRTNADRARQTELELASIGPFIELMPEEKKVAIREELTRVYFGKTVDPHTANHPLEGEFVKELISEIGKAIKK